MCHATRYIWNIGKIVVKHQSTNDRVVHNEITEIKIVLFYLLVILKHFDLFQRNVLQPIMYHVHSF